MLKLNVELVAYLVNVPPHLLLNAWKCIWPAEISLTHELSCHIWWLDEINSSQLIFFFPFLMTFSPLLLHTAAHCWHCSSAILCSCTWPSNIYPFSIHPSPSSGTSTARGEGVDKPGTNTITFQSQLRRVTWRCEEVWGSKGLFTQLVKGHWSILTLRAGALILFLNAWIKTS